MHLAMVAASTGTFSFLASVAVIFVIVLLKKYDFFIQRLILYLCIAAALNSASIMLRFSRVRYASDSADLDRLCTAAAFIDQTTLWSLTIAFCCMTFNMLIVTLFNRSTKGLEMGYIFFIFLFPLMFNWIPFLQHSYGESGAWCWIRTVNDDDDCSTHKLGMVLSLTLWYVPHYVVLAILFVSYIVTVLNVLRKRHHWKGVYSTELRTDQQKTKELIMPILFYPLGFLFLNLFPLINRLYDIFEKGDDPNYYLWLLHAVFSPLQGGYIAMVYVLDKDTLCRLHPRELWAHIKYRTTPVREYPATRGFTDSYEANKFSPDGSTSSFEDIKVALNEDKRRNYGSLEKEGLLSAQESEQV